MLTDAQIETIAKHSYEIIKASHAAGRGGRFIIHKKPRHMIQLKFLVKHLEEYPEVKPSDFHKSWLDNPTETHAPLSSYLFPLGQIFCGREVEREPYNKLSWERKYSDLSIFQTVRSMISMVKDLDKESLESDSPATSDQEWHKFTDQKPDIVSGQLSTIELKAPPTPPAFIKLKRCGTELVNIIPTKDIVMTQRKGDIKIDMPSNRTAYTDEPIDYILDVLNGRIKQELDPQLQEKAPERKWKTFGECRPREGQYIEVQGEKLNEEISSGIYSYVPSASSLPRHRVGMNSYFYFYSWRPAVNPDSQ